MGARITLVVAEVVSITIQRLEPESDERRFPIGFGRHESPADEGEHLG
jgi:hypothetical protein